MQYDDLLDMTLEDGSALNKDYDAEDNEQAPKAKKLSIGYGKAIIHSDKLLITNKDIVVPNEYAYLNSENKKVRAGYFSHSALQTYRRCQKQFYYKYVLGERKKRPAVKMWGGSAMHNTVEKLLGNKVKDPVLAKSIKEEAIRAQVEAGPSKSLLEEFNWKNVVKLPITTEQAVSEFKDSYDEFTQDYIGAQAFAINNNEPALPDISWGERIKTEAEFLLLYENAVKQYINSEFILSTPKELESTIVYHLPLHRGGTVPIVGFIDVIEHTEFMGEYTQHHHQGDTKALKVMQGVSNGEKMIVDHKCGGVARTYEDARTDQQLTLYSLAKGIDLVGFNNIKLGTTGGKNPKKAKPATVTKTFARRSAMDYEKLIDDYNAMINGISEGVFDKSGTCNPMVCSPTQCEYYYSKGCFGI